MLMGLVALILGALPGWIAGREITASFYSSRFSLASMLGASLFFIGLLEWITPRYFVKITLVSVMVAITTNYHIRTNDLYRASWDWQKNFYWQLYWRAPYIEPNTPFISDNEVLLYAGGYATAMGINLTYSEGAQAENLGYWFFALDDKLDGQINQFRNQKALRGNLRNLNFSGDSLDSLIINYDSKRCLHVLSDGRAENALLPASLQEVLPASNLSRIHPVTDKLPPDPHIFGSEPDHTWCYYYEKAELARQFEDWEQIAYLGDEAMRAGYTPYDPVEWFAFIEAYGLSGQVKQATAITQDIYNTRSDYGPPLCELWKGMADQPEIEVTLLSEWESLQRSLSCQTK